MNRKRASWDMKRKREEENFEGRGKEKERAEFGWKRATEGEEEGKIEEECVM